MTTIAAVSARRRAVSLPHVRHWRYQGGRRDLRLDLLRGFAAFAMIVDHIGGGERSWLYALTGGNHFFVSAAEAFVFISGLVMGTIYAGLIARDGAGAALARSLRRTWTLYCLTVALTLSFPAVSLLLGVPWAPDLDAGGLPAFITGVFTLHRTFFLSDVLLMYTFLVLAAGPVFALLARGRTRAVLAGSWALWALWQVWPAQVDLPWAITDNGTFHLPAWQVLFVTGLVLGYHRRTVERHVTRLRPGLVLAGSAGLVTAAIALHLAGVSTTGDGWAAVHLFAKADVRPGRLLVFVPVAAFAYTLLTVAWTPVRRALGWLLLPLGQDALTAYALHLFVVALSWKLTVTVVGGPHRTTTQTVIMQMCGVLLIWAVIRAKRTVTAQARALIAAIRAGRLPLPGGAAPRGPLPVG